MQIFVGVALVAVAHSAGSAGGAEAHAVEPAEQAGGDISADRAGSGGAVRDAGADLGLYCSRAVCDSSGGHAHAGRVEPDEWREWAIGRSRWRGLLDGNADAAQRACLSETAGGARYTADEAAPR